MDKWDIRFYQLAQTVSAWSKDPEVKVGAILAAEDKRQFSPGYNGLPRGIFDNPDLPKEERVMLSVHAEQNALLNSAFSPKDGTVYVTKTPCIDCAKLMIQSQIARVVCAKPNKESSWYLNQSRAISLLSEAGIDIDFNNGE